MYPAVVNIPAPYRLAGKAAVAIDVLRATSTIVMALANGAARVIPVETPQEATALAEAHPEHRYLLGGERHGRLIPGFHLCNSPREYSRQVVEGRDLLFTTTNGTRAIRRAAAGASYITAAGFLNAPAVADWLAELGCDVALCCGGRDDNFALEDVGCAGAIATLLARAVPDLEMDDLARAASRIYQLYEGRVYDLVRDAEHAGHITLMGVPEDLEACAQFGTCQVVPRYWQGHLHIWMQQKGAPSIMRIDVFPTVVNIPPAEEMDGKAAVAIDVLRATSTIITALVNGADTVVPVLSPEEAFQVVRDNPDREFMLGGERKSVLIPGFHLGNSPLEYTRVRVGGLPVLFTTTNGTRAIRRAAGARDVYIAGLLNAPAVAEALRAQGRDVAICCAGTHDQFSLEDAVCAGAILEFMSGPDSHLEMGDMAFVCRDLFRQYDGRLADLLHLSEHGQNLVKLGLHEDLIFCAQLGTTTLVPKFHDGQVTA